MPTPNDQLMEAMRIEPFTPGPLERSWRARLHWLIFRRWPRYVAEERLADYDRRTDEAKARVTAFFEGLHDDGRH